MADKVMHPPKSASRKGSTTKQAKSGIIEGPTAKGGSNNLNPYNRSGRVGKK
jgi:hypothetical protein